jgi:hypothetical protein
LFSSSLSLQLLAKLRAMCRGRIIGICAPNPGPPPTPYSRHESGLGRWGASSGMCCSVVLQHSRRRPPAAAVLPAPLRPPDRPVTVACLRHRRTGCRWVRTAGMPETRPFRPADRPNLKSESPVTDPRSGSQTRSLPPAGRGRSASGRWICRFVPGHSTRRSQPSGPAMPAAQTDGRRPGMTSHKTT